MKYYVAILIVYVDDIVVSEIDEAEIKDLKAYLRNKFEIKDLGELKYLLGFEVAGSKKVL